jgi:hypothetical protein
MRRPVMMVMMKTIDEMAVGKPGAVGSLITWADRNWASSARAAGWPGSSRSA